MKHPTSSDSDGQDFTLKDDGCKPARLSPGLYVVATPIGNLRDITLRALDVLQSSAIIYCEDTRVTRRLTQTYGIDAPLRSYHEHNGERRRPAILEQLAAGDAVALVSDAGTPLISDPGYKLVRAVRDAGHRVFPIPGASSVTASLSAAGLPTDRFLFLGFLPAKPDARRKLLREAAQADATLVMFDSPHRVAATLRDIQAVMADRETVMCRELTKRFEEFRQGLPLSLSDALGETRIRGEIVMMVAPGTAEARRESEHTHGIPINDLLTQLQEKGLSYRDAVTAVSTITGRPKKDVYASGLDNP